MGDAGPIASLADERLRGAVRDRASRRFIEAWLAWRGPGRLMPTRSALEIADIRELLGQVALFEVLGPDKIMIKVAGTRLRDITNVEATGRNFAELTPPEVWPVRRYRMMQVASRPCAGVAITRDRRTLGDGVTFEIVSLPIDADQPGGARLLIHCVTSIEGGFQPPTPDRQPVMLLPDRFEFLDIGAGTPERIEP